MLIEFVNGVDFESAQFVDGTNGMCDLECVDYGKH